MEWWWTSWGRQQRPRAPGGTPWRGPVCWRQCSWPACCWGPACLGGGTCLGWTAGLHSVCIIFFLYMYPVVHGAWSKAFLSTYPSCTSFYLLNICPPSSFLLSLIPLSFPFKIDFTLWRIMYDVIVTIKKYLVINCLLNGCWCWCCVRRWCKCFSRLLLL